MKDLRFDLISRVEVWVTEEEIKAHLHFDKVVGSDMSDEDKIEELKDIAKDIAYDKVAEANGANGVGAVEITAGISAEDININRIDWSRLLGREEV